MAWSNCLRVLGERRERHRSSALTPFSRDSLEKSPLGFSFGTKMQRLRAIETKQPGSFVVIDNDISKPPSHYLVQSKDIILPSLGSIRLGKKLSPGLNPATVVYLDGDLRAKIGAFQDDDEFELNFLQVVILVVSKKPHISIKRSYAILKDQGCKSIFAIHQVIPEGPYFAQGEALYRTWRLYPDVYDAFQLPTISQLDEPTKFSGITITHEGNLMVPVPSRLYFPKTKQKPLNGMRVTIKDIIDLEGVKTTGQSRSYEKLYGPRSRTAAFVAKLIKYGAIIIGKTKCTQFASSDQPTADWVEYHCPWNPRGDGYLSPRGSSTGTCVAVAGYHWCDFGIGSDSRMTPQDQLESLKLTGKLAGGSIRGPASVMGLFALRPTQSLELLPGFLQIIPDIDTPGLTCRDAELFHRVCLHAFGRRWSRDEEVYDNVTTPVRSALPNGEAHREYGLSKLLLDFQQASRHLIKKDVHVLAPGTNLQDIAIHRPSPWQSPVRPTTLLYPEDYWDQWPEGPVKQQMEVAVKKLEAYLQTPRVAINLANIWLKDNPHGNGSSLAEDLEDVRTWHLYCKDLGTKLTSAYTSDIHDASMERFRRDFEQEYGHQPYVHPVIQDCWKRGESLTSAEVEKARHHKRMYSEWLREKILGGGGFNVMMVYPVGDFTPFYRDVYRPDPKDRATTYNWFEREDHQSSLAGVPSVVIPVANKVAQVEQPSKITGKSQNLPVAISLMSGRGTDVDLTNLILEMTKLDKGGFAGKVKVGKEAF
ncbi:amidase signature domain-containing protein [Triangularia setosa]|uniref:Amidase signature domain-containing protein n=1 Tax=Triangularia setosa TaxID=2587417 RepID=A0AAN6WE62_9PEZI|nr:amidase signature domain-containing protein [Podospora setosa]